MVGNEESGSGGRKKTERKAIALAHSLDQWLVKDRPELSGWNVEELSLGHDGQAGHLANESVIGWRKFIRAGRPSTVL